MRRSALFMTVGLLLCGVAYAATPQVAVDSGNNGSYTASDGTVYAADNGTGGGQSTDTCTVGNTPDIGLYQSARWGNTTYSFTVPNGWYNVTLKYNEGNGTFGVGSRVFNVTINGTQVLSSFDIFKEVGFCKALDKTFKILVSNGNITIKHLTITDSPTVSAIRVDATTPPAGCSPCQTINLEWAGQGPGNTYNLNQSLDNGVSWTALKTGLATPFTQVDVPTTGLVLIRVTAVKNNIEGAIPNAGIYILGTVNFSPGAGVN
jgi:hypothetical protein